MKEWAVVQGPASTDLARRLVEELKCPLIGVTVDIFPDGESRLRIEEEPRSRPVILVQSTYPPVDRHLVQTLLLSHRLSSEGCEVCAFMPYMGYARQDREFLKGEVVSLRVLADLLAAAGVKRLVTVDVHSEYGVQHFAMPFHSLSGMPALAGYLGRRYDLARPLAVSPDFGGSARVEAFSAALKAEFITLQKTRDRVTGEVKVEGELDARGRDVVIADDIISTGGSVEKAALLLRQAGAKRILAACTHPVLAENALERILKAGVEEVVATNTIPTSVSKVDVAPLAADYFRNL